jgi:hypothetical protein
MGAEDRVRKMRKMSERKRARERASFLGEKELRGRRMGCCRYTVSYDIKLRKLKTLQNWFQEKERCSFSASSSNRRGRGRMAISDWEARASLCLHRLISCSYVEVAA